LIKIKVICCICAGSVSSRTHLGVELESKFDENKFGSVQQLGFHKDKDIAILQGVAATSGMRRSYTGKAWQVYCRILRGVCKKEGGEIASGVEITPDKVA
jgi:hypothetical protein